MMVQLGDIVRWRLYIGRVTWIRGQEAGLMSLEGTDAGVKAKLAECEFVARPSIAQTPERALGEALLEKRIQREHNIRLLRNAKQKVAQVMDKLKRGEGTAQEIIREVQGGKFGE